MQKISMKCLVSVVQISALMFIGATHAAAEKVYVADEEGNTVSVIDATSFKRIGSIPVGQGPHNVQVAPDGKQVWVTNNGEPVKAVHNMPKSEHGAMSGSGEIWAIDTATDAVAVAAKVPVGVHPAHVVVTPDGRFAYVANGGENTVCVVDISARRVVDTIPVGVSPHGMRISSDGKQAWVANLKGGTISVIDTAVRKETMQIAVGSGPAQVGFTPDGRLGFVSLSGENRVAVIAPVSRKVISKIAVGTVPIQLYATPDSQLLLVANQGTRQNPGSTVSVIDFRSFKVVSTIKTGKGAHGVAIDRKGLHAFVTNLYEDTVSVIDILQRKVIATIPVGRLPNGVSVTP